MSFERRDPAPDPLAAGVVPGRVEKRRDLRSDVVASGTLACPSCDAPVAPHGAMGIGARLCCPFCGHAGRVRDFLSLATPTRPAHVVVRVTAGGVPRCAGSRAICE